MPLNDEDLAKVREIVREEIEKAGVNDDKLEVGAGNKWSRDTALAFLVKQARKVKP